MKKIYLTRGFVAFVDDADYERVSEFKWRAVKTRTHVYAARSVRISTGVQSNLFLHRFLVADSPMVDHEDGNGLNNQRYNLRPCTNQQNQRAFAHKREGASSLYRGVFWNSRCSKWSASIRLDGRSNFLGLFSVEEDAARAYDTAAIQRDPKFFSINFPQEHTICPT